MSKTLTKTMKNARKAARAQNKRATGAPAPLQVTTTVSPLDIAVPLANGEKGSIRVWADAPNQASLAHLLSVLQARAATAVSPEVGQQQENERLVQAAAKMALIEALEALTGTLPEVVVTAVDALRGNIALSMAHLKALQLLTNLRPAPSTQES